jgi:hypothetical protein
LPEDCLEILEKWRAPIQKDSGEQLSISDPSAPDLEPALTELNSATGIGWWK